MAGYVDVDTTADEPAELSAQAFAYIMANVAGFRPNENHLTSWMIGALARMVSEAQRVAGLVPISIFRWFGRTLLGLAPVDADAATVETTWTFRDVAGYTVPEGTVAGFRVTGDQLVLFSTVEPATAEPGNLTVDVTMRALDVGDAANEIPAGPMELVDALAYVDSVESLAVTAGGVEGETDDAYLDRLAEELQLLTPRPIYATDFAVLARRIAGVHRATALDNYDPADSSFDNERMVHVVVVDADGAALDVDTKAAVAAYLQAMREVNFIVTVGDPTYTAVAVAYSFTTTPGYDEADVADRSEAAVASYLSSAVWGGGTESPPVWRNQTTVYFWEVVALLNSIAGLDRLTALTLNGGTVDVDLAGDVALPTPGAIVGTPV